MTNKIVPHAWVGDKPEDGFILEWIGNQIRFGLWVERNPPEVSWTLVSNDEHDYFEGDVLPVEMVKDLADALNAILATLAKQELK